MPTAANRPLRETTLLIGLPITEEEFGARLADSDLLARFRSTSSDSGPDADLGERRAKRSWKQYFSATAAPVSELREDAERLGARVVTRATLADFRKATAKFETVILLSHWKGPEVSFEDILRTPSTEHLRRLAWQNSPVTRRLRERLIERGLDRETGDGGPVSCTQARTALRQALNAVVQAEENFEQDDDAPVIEHPVTVRTRRRDEIDTLFSGFVRPGNRIELFDGMHDKADIETAIAPGFGG